MSTSKPRKYRYLYVLQGDYGYGWEDLSAEDKNDWPDVLNGPGPMARIRQTRKEYRENEGGTYRIVERREANPDYTPAPR